MCALSPSARFDQRAGEPVEGTGPIRQRRMAVGSIRPARDPTDHPPWQASGVGNLSPTRCSETVAEPVSGDYPVTNVSSRRIMANRQRRVGAKRRTDTETVGLAP
eukprot:1778503-Pyramimonas_sp.AAC.1